MKFLKKYNESKISSDLLDLCNDCFLDIKDEGADVYIDIDSENDSYISICISFVIIDDYSSINNFYECKKSFFNYLEMTKLSIDKIKSLHNDDIEVDFSYDKSNSGSQSIHTFYLSISEVISSIGDFYKIKDNVCTINYNKLRNILSLPAKISINGATNGSYSMLYFYFPTKEDLRIYKDDLIERFSNIKIGDTFLNQPHSLEHSSSPKIKYKIAEDYNRHSSTGYYDRKKDIVHYIEFGLSTEFKYW